MIYIDEIIEHKRHKLERAEEESPMADMEKTASPVPNRGFKDAISKKNGINLIAEIKKASPSHGIIRHDYHPSEIAKIYEENGAAALSILTEDKYFKGDIDHLKTARETTSLPVLRKDFIISEYQIYESAIARCDAILLIAGILDRGILKGLYHEAKALNMDVLVEVHDERDLDKAISCGAQIIGINNRNLKTLEIDLDATFKMIEKVPQEKTIVSESGIRDNEEVVRLAQAGVRAVLIGTVFMEADDIAAEVKRVMG